MYAAVEAFRFCEAVCPEASLDENLDRREASAEIIRPSAVDCSAVLDGCNAAKVGKQAQMIETELSTNVHRKQTYPALCALYAWNS